MANSPLSVLPGIPSGFDVTKTNAFGPEADLARQEWEKASESAASSLEQRYANPNWFNVAAGFLKPQLGGFAASLGSAAQAMGENLEKQREMQLPAAQMRAQVALSKVTRANQQKAAELTEELRVKPGGLLATDVSKVAQYDTERAKILQEQLLNESKQRADIMAAHAAGRSDAELEAQYGPTFKQLFPSGTPEIAAVPGATAKKPESKGTSAETPPIALNMTQAQWDTVPLQRKNELIASLGETSKDVNFASEKSYRTAAEQAQPRMELFKSMRELAAPTDPELAAGMNKAFNVLGGSDVVSLAGKALSQGRLTERLAELEPLLVQAGIDDPRVRSRVAMLAKMINENKANSGMSTAVTDQATALRGAGNPSFDNPRDAFISLTDALAHRERDHIDMFGALMGNNAEKKKYAAPEFINTDEWKNRKRAFMDRHRQILETAPTDKTPSWYFPDVPTAAPAAAPARPAAGAARPAAPAAATAAGAAAGSTRARLEERLNRGF